MKPYVVLHILTNLSGTIAGPYFGDPAIAPSSKAYPELRKELNCDAVVYGLTTMVEGYSNGLIADEPEIAEPVLFEDFIADNRIGNYIVSLDPYGQLVFDNGYQQKKNRPKAHVIEIVTARTTQASLERLKKNGVSVLCGGRNAIDLKAVLEKLASLFGIKRLMVAGGGICDRSFAREGLLDEISLVIAPIAQGDPNAPSVFASIKEDERCISYHLSETRIFEQDAIWMDYKA